MIDVSIIIISYNTKDILKQCVDSVVKQTKAIQYEIIIVDNASKDGSAEMIKTDFPDIVLIENQENKGFAAANNQGIIKAKGQYILFLNSDTIILGSAIDKMIRFCNENSDVHALGCKLLNQDRTLQPSCYRFPSLIPIIGNILHLWIIPAFRKTILLQTLVLSHYDKIHKADYVRGACLLIKRKVIECIGMFDERFFIYTEEADFCYRLKKAGFQLKYFPFAEVVHLGGGSSEPYVEALLFEKHKNPMQYYEKHHGRVAVILYRILMMVRLIIQIIERSIFNIFRLMTNRSVKSVRSFWCLFKWLAKGSYDTK